MRDGRDRLEQLQQDAQDRQAMSLANRDQVDLEGWPAGRMRRIHEAHHEMSSRECPLWLRVAGQVVLIIGLFVLVMAASVVGELAGGWPL